MANFIDLTGQRFGKLTAIRYIQHKAGVNNSAGWVCLCDCGNTAKARSHALRHGGHVSCGKHKNWQGVGELSGAYFSCIKRGAKYRNLPFKISKKYIWELFLKQNRKCALSGEPLKFVRVYSDTRARKQTASLDRIDSSKGYTKDNVQWIHKDINRMKLNLSEDRFRYLCKLVTNKRKE